MRAVTINREFSLPRLSFSNQTSDNNIVRAIIMFPIPGTYVSTRVSMVGVEGLGVGL